MYSFADFTATDFITDERPGVNNDRYLERSRSESQLLYRRLFFTSIRRRFHSTITTVTIQTDLQTNRRIHPASVFAVLYGVKRSKGGHTLAGGRKF
jgi:hypothetical protein